MSDKTREGSSMNRPILAAGPAESHSGHALPNGKSNERRAHQKAITQGLRKFFDTVASEPVPDEFMELLNKLDNSKKEG
jgi:Anti-sigma factor NepR